MKCKTCNREMDTRDDYVYLFCPYCGTMRHEILCNILSEQDKTSREILSRLDGIEELLITIKYITDDARSTKS